VGGNKLASDIATLWNALSAEIKSLAGLSFAAISETGVVLSSTEFASLAFPEGETLHFKPAAKP